MKSKKRNHRYHSDLLKLAFISFADIDRRKARRQMWNIRIALRKQFPFPEFLIGCSANFKDGRILPTLDFVNFQDFLDRYYNLQSPFFITQQNTDNKI